MCKGTFYVQHDAKGMMPFPAALSYVPARTDGQQAYLLQVVKVY